MSRLFEKPCVCQATHFVVDGLLHLCHESNQSALPVPTIDYMHDIFEFEEFGDGDRMLVSRLKNFQEFSESHFVWHV